MVLLPSATSSLLAFMSSLSVENWTDGGGGGNGCKWLRYEYENCMCRHRATLKIVADARKASFGMLYFVCEKKGTVGGCNYFRWCHPKRVDFEGCNYLVGNNGHEDEVGGEDEIGGEDEVHSEVYPKRCEGGSKVKDYILVLVAGFSLVVSFVAIMVSLME